VALLCLLPFVSGCGSATEKPDNDSGAVQQQQSAVIQQSEVQHSLVDPDKPDQTAIKPDEEAMTATRQGYAVQTGVVPNQTAVSPAQSAPIQVQQSPVKAL